MAKKGLSAVLEGVGKIVFKEFDLPKIGPEDGLLRIEMAGVCGSDPKVYYGKMPINFPIILGHEMVGYIEDIGEIASQRWGVVKGDRVITDGGAVCGHCYYCTTGKPRWCQNRLGFLTSCNKPPHLWGAYGQYQYLPPGSSVFKLPEDISMEAAVLINAVIANAIQWVSFVGQISIEDTIVIQGGGAQGIAATIVAKMSGASPIIITGLTRDEPNFKLAKKFGADYTINVEKEDIVNVVRKMTNGRMADLVLDVTGSSSGIAKIVDLAKIQGTVILASLGAGSTSFVTDRIALNEIRIQGVFSHTVESMLAAMKLIQSKRYPVEEMVTHKYPLAKAEEALKATAGEIPGVKPLRAVLLPWA